MTDSTYAISHYLERCLLYFRHNKSKHRHSLPIFTTHNLNPVNPHKPIATSPEVTHQSIKYVPLSQTKANVSTPSLQNAPKLAKRFHDDITFDVITAHHRVQSPLIEHHVENRVVKLHFRRVHDAKVQIGSCRAIALAHALYSDFGQVDIRQTTIADVVQVFAEARRAAANV